MPATKSPYAAGTAKAAGNEAETTPGTKKLSPMVRRNMWGATKGRSASCWFMVRRRGQTKRFAATPEATKLISALRPNRARISIEILLTRRLGLQALSSLDAQAEAYATRGAEGSRKASLWLGHSREACCSSSASKPRPWRASSGGSEERPGG